MYIYLYTHRISFWKETPKLATLTAWRDGDWTSGDEAGGLFTVDPFLRFEYSLIRKVI